MYADPSARAGVLEPEGIVEIKFRDAELRKAMLRTDGQLRQLAAQGGQEAAMNLRQQHLLPVYHQVMIAHLLLH